MPLHFVREIEPAVLWYKSEILDTIVLVFCVLVLINYIILCIRSDMSFLILAKNSVIMYGRGAEDDAQNLNFAHACEITIHNILEFI